MSEHRKPPVHWARDLHGETRVMDEAEAIAWMDAALAAQATAHEAALAAAYTLMGASIQSAIEAEQQAARTVVAGFLTPRQNGKTQAALAEAHERGVRAERARIRAGVKALPAPWPTTAMGVLPLEWVLAVIDALRGES